MWNLNWVVISSEKELGVQLEVSISELWSFRVRHSPEDVLPQLVLLIILTMQSCKFYLCTCMLCAFQPYMYIKLNFWFLWQTTYTYITFSQSGSHMSIYIRVHVHVGPLLNITKQNKYKSLLKCHHNSRFWGVCYVESTVQFLAVYPCKQMMS